MNESYLTVLYPDGDGWSNAIEDWWYDSEGNVVATDGDDRYVVGANNMWFIMDKTDD